jgi:hypothetical protein
MQGVSQSGFQAQIGEMIGSGECTFQACSSDNLRMIKGKILGNDNAHLSNNACTTNNTGSLLNMSKMLSTLKLLLFSANRTISVYPGAQMNMRAEGSYTNYMIFLQSVFRYWKGGVRYSVVPQTVTDMTVSCSTLPQSNLAYYAVLADIVPPLADALDSSTSLVVCPVTSRNPFDVILPYNCIWNCLPTMTGTIGIAGFYGNAMLLRVAGTTVSDSMLLSGGADDYLLGFQLQIPLCNGLSNV